MSSSFGVIPRDVYGMRRKLGTTLLCGSSRSKVLRRVSGLIPLGRIRAVALLDPCFSRCKRSLVALSRLYPGSAIGILVRRSYTLPPDKVLPGDDVRFCSFDRAGENGVTFGACRHRLRTGILRFGAGSTRCYVINDTGTALTKLKAVARENVGRRFKILCRSAGRSFLSALNLGAGGEVSIPAGESGRSGRTPSRAKEQLELLSTCCRSNGLGICDGRRVPSKMLLSVSGKVRALMDRLGRSGNGECDASVGLTGARCAYCLISGSGGSVSGGLFIG